MIPPFGTMATPEEQAVPFPGIEPLPPSPPGSSLTVEHVCLDSEHPTHSVTHHQRESLLYALTGRLRVYANGLFLGTLGGRTSVIEPLAHVLRFPAGTLHEVTVLLEGFSADYLWVACAAVENWVTKLPYLHWNDTPFHVVGNGTHQRRVGEVQTPPGFHLYCGQTVQEAGTTSSFPPHATMADLQLYADGKTTWQEMFFCTGTKPAQAVLYGIYPDGKQVNQTITLNNGDIVPMPLGSHMVQAAPEGWFSYHWFYVGSALRKKYNKFSTNVDVYLS